MRSTIWIAVVVIIFEAAISGCGGNSETTIGNEVDALITEAPNVKDDASSKAFYQKRRAIMTKIKSLPNEKQVSLLVKLQLMEASMKSLAGSPLDGLDPE